MYCAAGALENETPAQPALVDDLGSLRQICARREQPSTRPRPSNRTSSTSKDESSKSTARTCRSLSTNQPRRWKRMRLLFHPMAARSGRAWSHGWRLHTSSSLVVCSHSMLAMTLPLSAYWNPCWAGSSLEGKRQLRSRPRNGIKPREVPNRKVSEMKTSRTLFIPLASPS